MIEALSKVAELGKEVSKESGKNFKDFDRRKSISPDVKEKNNTPESVNKKPNIDKRLPFMEGAERPPTAPDALEKSNLTDAQKADLSDNGFSKSMFERTTYKEGVYTVKTDNCKLADQKHPDTKVPFKTKIVDVLGTKIEGVFAEFDSKFDATLPENKIIASDKAQFSECNAQLKDAINKNPELRKQFSDRQLAQIEQGITPSRYVWHHNEVRGIMQLVDAETHAATGHTGGKAIWGGGSEAR